MNGTFDRAENLGESGGRSYAPVGAASGVNKPVSTAKTGTENEFILSFKRYEAKYLVTKTQYEAFREALADIIAVDRYGLTKICNLYYDTHDWRLVRTSIDKPVYKEKLRLRSYGVPPNDGVTSFVEIKKKFKGIVYKRREALPLSVAMDYLSGKIPAPRDGQIMRELDWFLKYYQTLTPRMFISYDRLATYCIENPELRMTFDTNITWRTEDLDLTHGSYGNIFLDEDMYLIEIKIPGAIPIWLARVLDGLHIRQCSLSKIGACYQYMIGADAHPELLLASARRHGLKSMTAAEKTAVLDSVR